MQIQYNFIITAEQNCDRKQNESDGLISVFIDINVTY